MPSPLPRVQEALDLLELIPTAPLRVAFGLDLLADRLDKLYKAHAKAQRARHIAKRKAAARSHQQSYGSMCKQL